VKDEKEEEEEEEMQEEGEGIVIRTMEIAP
jgi:hypothetical protein